MPRVTLADISALQKTLITRRFLKKQLEWLDRVCLEWSRQAATGDVYAVGQYQHFKAYRGTVKHLIFLAGRNAGTRKPHSLRKSR